MAAPISQEKYGRLVDAFRTKFRELGAISLIGKDEITDVAKICNVPFRLVQRAWDEGFAKWVTWGPPISEYLLDEEETADAMAGRALLDKLGDGGLSTAEKQALRKVMEVELRAVEVEVKWIARKALRSLLNETAELTAMVPRLRNQIEADLGQKVLDGSMGADEAMAWISRIAGTFEKLARISNLTKGEVAAGPPERSELPSKAEVDHTAKLYEEHIERRLAEELRKRGVEYKPEVTEIVIEAESVDGDEGEVEKVDGWRIVLVGGPSCGKTTLSNDLALEHEAPVRHTDDLKDMEWSVQSEEVARWFDEPGPWVIEGVVTARALRKWLKVNPGAPCDEVIVLLWPHKPLGLGQSRMLKGVATVWKEVEDELVERGVSIVDDGFQGGGGAEQDE